jgi:hypothetical protein
MLLTIHLYKISAPRADMMFYPSTYWHTSDWESSTTRCQEGYIEDEVLYVRGGGAATALPIPIQPPRVILSQPTNSWAGDSGRGLEEDVELRTLGVGDD